MKGGFILRLAAAAGCIVMIMAFAGCGDSCANKDVEEPEITADYLCGDYANQLLTDGAKTVLGSVEMTRNGDAYTATVTEKEVVSSDQYENGYYIAETNVVKDYVLEGEARIVYMENGQKTVGNADYFVKNHNGETDQLYTVYLMGDRAELFIPVNPEDVNVRY